VRDMRDIWDVLPGVFPEGDKAAKAWEWRTRELSTEEKDLPATGISFNDIAGILLPALNAHAPEGLAWRLPTEAEWEWAVRAGTATPFYTGPEPDENADAIEMLKRQEVAAIEAGWLTANSKGSLQPVRGLKPNAWGLYDMHGNAQEIVADYYDPAFALTATANAVAEADDATAAKDPRNDVMPDGRPLHVIRGGSYASSPAEARSARREIYHANNRHAVVGVRLVLSEK